MQDSFCYKIRGGSPLMNECQLPGAKNAALPAIIAACLSDEVTQLTNVPTESNDVKVLIFLLNEAGANVSQPVPGTLLCSAPEWKGGQLDNSANLLRHSLLMLGLSAHRNTPLSLPLPGGCKLGSRKHDLHLLAFRELGFDFHEVNDALCLSELKERRNRTIEFHYPSFGATINVLLAATGIKGCVTTLKNAAKNPEVLDLIELLTKMGANIRWTADRTLCVEGTSSLSGTSHRILSDRIIASTLIAAAGVTRGNIVINGINQKYLQTEIQTWQRAGLNIQSTADSISVQYSRRLSAQSIRTVAYPGFHTDIQPLHGALMVFAEGTSTIYETILNGRFKYAEELQKMGADTAIGQADYACVNGEPGQFLTIQGVHKVHGAELTAPDIRGGAALVLVALTTEDETTINNIYQIERGYGDMAALLSPLGVDIKRESTTTKQSA